MRKIFNKKRLMRQEGQGLVEYALLLVMVSVVVIGVLLILGPKVRDVFDVVVWRLGYREPFTGDVAVTGTISVTAKATGGLGTCDSASDVQATATFTVQGADGPVRGVVTFQHIGGKAKDLAGVSPLTASDLGGSGSKKVKACLVGVRDYNLTNAPVCAEAQAC
ncbi:hypothetical protein QUF58_04985 [Anaerolineales bacterium HSG24]|nr:hypothetical protein [Anaerolineales bacterium HSG24]